MTNQASNPTGASNPPHAAIQTLLADTRRELQELDGQIEPLTVKRRIVLERLTALEHVDKLYRDPNTPAAAVSDDVPKDEEAPAAVLAPITRIRPAGGTSVRTTVRNRVKTILSESTDDAMHINTIAQQFQDRGWSIPGAGKAANLTAHLSNAPDFYSPKRGFWKLGPNPSATAAGAKKAKPKKRIVRRQAGA